MWDSELLDSFTGTADEFTPRTFTYCELLYFGHLYLDDLTHIFVTNELGFFFTIIYMEIE